MGLFSKLKKVTKEVTGIDLEGADEAKIDANDSQKEENTYDKGSNKFIGNVELPAGWEDYTGKELRYHTTQLLLQISNVADGDSEARTLGFKDEDHFRALHEISNNSDYFPELLDAEGNLDQGASTIEYQNSVREQAKDMEGEGEILAPIDGVSCATWASANAKIASNGDWTDEVLTIISGDRAKWDKVNNAWQERMSNDTSFVIAQIYGDAFNASATGNLGGMADINETNFPFEKYIEVSVAMKHMTDQGKDPQQALSLFDLTVADYSNVSTFWSNKQNENINYYHELRIQLEEKFDKKYEAGDLNDDISF